MTILTRTTTVGNGSVQNIHRNYARTRVPGYQGPGGEVGFPVQTAGMATTDELLQSLAAGSVLTRCASLNAMPLFASHGACAQCH